MSEPLFELIIPGEPAPKKRPRFSVSPKGRAMTYTDAATVAAELVIAQTFKSSFDFDEPLTDLIAVDIEFWTRKVIGGRDARGHIMRPADADNLEKLVLDALNEIVWQDDIQIVESRKRVHRDPDCEPRTV